MKVRIIAFESLNWSWARARIVLLIVLTCWLIITLMFFPFGILIGRSSKMVITLAFLLIFMLIACSSAGFFTLEMEEKKFANQGIWKSAIYAMIFMLPGGLIAGLILGLGGSLTNGLTFGLKLGLGSSLIGGFILGFNYGGTAYIQHRANASKV